MKKLQFLLLLVLALLPAEQARALFYFGDYTKDNPFIISTPEDFVAYHDILDDINESRVAKPIYAKLVADLDMAGITLTPAGSKDMIGAVPMVSFEGNNHTIRNLNIKVQPGFNGIFASVTHIYTDDEEPPVFTDLTLENITFSHEGGTGTLWGGGILAGRLGGNVYNVTIRNSSIDLPDTEGVAALAGSITLSQVIANVNVIDCTVRGGDCVGGLQGKYEIAAGAVDIFNCHVKGGSIEGMDNVGGLVGNGTPRLLASTNSASVKGHKCVGGIIGLSGKGYISSCANYGTVYGSFMYAAGICGLTNFENPRTIRNCINMGAVSGDDYVANFANLTNGQTNPARKTVIANCYYDSTVNPWHPLEGELAIGEGDFVLTEESSGYPTSAFADGTIAYKLFAPESTNNNPAGVYMSWYWGQALMTRAVGPHPELYFDPEHAMRVVREATVSCRGEVLGTPIYYNGSEDAIEVVHAGKAHHEAEAVNPCLLPSSREYWSCSDCGLMCSDEEMTSVITRDDLVIAPTGHIEDGNGVCTVCHQQVLVGDGVAYITLPPGIENVLLRYFAPRTKRIAALIEAMGETDGVSIVPWDEWRRQLERNAMAKSPRRTPSEPEYCFFDVEEGQSYAIMFNRPADAGAATGSACITTAYPRVLELSLTGRDGKVKENYLQDAVSDISDGEAESRFVSEYGVIYRRDWDASRWGTVVMPFTLKSDDCITYFTLSGTTGMEGFDVMMLTPVETVAPNTPAIYRFNREAESYQYELGGRGSVTVDVPEAYGEVKASTSAQMWSMLGTYEDKFFSDADVLAGCRCITDDAFVTPVGSLSIRPYRAMLVYEGHDSLPAETYLIAVEGEEAPTCIKAVATAGGIEDVRAIYDISGRRMDNLHRGVNIIRTADGKTCKIFR